MRLTAQEFHARYRNLIPEEHRATFDLDLADRLNAEREWCAKEVECEKETAVLCAMDGDCLLSRFDIAALSIRAGHEDKDLLISSQPLP